MIEIDDRTRLAEAGSMNGVSACGRNPLGLKCGPSLKPDELIRLIDLLDPTQEAGRLTLICRFGADKIEASLPPLIRAVEREGRKVLWSCDPDAQRTDD